MNNIILLSIASASLLIMFISGIGDLIKTIDINSPAFQFAFTKIPLIFISLFLGQGFVVWGGVLVDFIINKIKKNKKDELENHDILITRKGINDKELKLLNEIRDSIVNMINEFTKGEKFESFYFKCPLLEDYLELQVNNTTIFKYKKHINQEWNNRIFIEKYINKKYIRTNYELEGCEKCIISQNEEHFSENIKIHLNKLCIFKPNYTNLLFCIKLEKDLKKISKQLKPILIF